MEEQDGNGNSAALGTLFQPEFGQHVAKNVSTECVESEPDQISVAVHLRVLAFRLPGSGVVNGQTRDAPMAYVDLVPVCTVAEVVYPSSRYWYKLRSQTHWKTADV